MLLSHLENSLRKTIRQRIEAGVLSGTALANKTGFQQAHVSNFLNQRRGLSVEGFDRMLEALGLSITDLIAQPEPVPSMREYDDVPLVDASIAHHPDFAARDVIDVLKFKRAFLRRVRASQGNLREERRRFVIIKANAENALAMYPRMLPGAALLIDRHYISLDAYRRREPNIYAVSRGKEVLVRYVERQGQQLLLRPANHNTALMLLEDKGDPIIGRVCHIGCEV